MKEVEELSVFELIDELLRWHATYRDYPGNYDAKLLKQAATVLETQFENMLEARRQRQKADKWKRKFLRCKYRAEFPGFTSLTFLRLLQRECRNPDVRHRDHYLSQYREEIEEIVDAKVVLPLP
jgi:hypothetical protein